ncbi:hypothetical protein ACFT9M_03800 [Micromonospora purpureochromogenes]|uniref:hypothetical protein n=1 Tax=Micromonospora purpureochromogenes TaxID=47872 RepID=UPI003638AA5E
MTSPTQPERQVEEDLTRQGYPEAEPTARGRSEDIEAEAELKVGPFQGKVRLRDGAGRTSSSWSHMLEVLAALMWPAGVAGLLRLVGAPAAVTVSATIGAIVISLIVFGVRMWLARKERGEK